MGSESLAFKEWARAEGLVLEGDISNLQGSVLGVDAEDYLHSLLTNTHTREPLLPALGGLPFALTQHVDDDLDSWKAADITPKFFFNGLEAACNDRRSIGKETQRAVRTLDDAWSVYDQGRGDEAVQAFGKACTYRTNHILRYLFFYLHGKGVEVLVAPYSAAAWMAYLDEIAKPNQIDGCVGSASHLVFGAQKVITDLDWARGKFSFISIQQVLSKLLFSHTQFTDLCLLSGSSILPVMPEIDSDSTISKITAARAVMARANQDGHTACMQAKDEEYLALFRKAKMAVRHMVVIYDDGEVKQLNHDTCPTDAHDFIGQRLPEELINYQTRGLVGGQVLNWRTRHEVFEAPPLDGGVSEVYKDLVQNKLRGSRARSLALLTHSLHRYFQKQDVDLVCWFNESDKRPLGIPELPLTDITREADKWHVSDSVLAQSATTMDPVTSPLAYAIDALSDEGFAKKTVTSRADGESATLKAPSEVLANTRWRFLQDRGYINSDHTLSAWGRALHFSYQRASRDGALEKSGPYNETEEAIFLAFELLRHDVLDIEVKFPLPPYSGAPMRGSDTDKAHNLLISRVASLGSFQHDKIGYTGPLSRHLIAYHQIVAAVRDSLRDLTEMHAASMLLGGSVARVRDFREYTTLGARLPFIVQPDLGLALVVKSYLDELSNDPARRADIRRWFNHALDIDGDLAKAWKLWDAVNAGVQHASSTIVSAEKKTMFREADHWLYQKRRVDEQPNGITKGNV